MLLNLKKNLKSNVVITKTNDRTSVDFNVKFSARIINDRAYELRIDTLMEFLPICFKQIML